MDDQFHSRTDDDLFADDFDPIPEPTAAPAPQAVTVAAPEASQVPQASQRRSGNNTLAASRHAPPPASTPSQPRPKQQGKPAPRQGSPQPRPNQNNDESSGPPNKPAASSSDGTAAAAETTSSTPATALPAGPANPSTPSSSRNKPNAALRLKSGANPRTKLTDAELTAKLADMRILNAAKQSSFQRAEADEARHAEAMERDQEVTRQRLKEEAARKAKAVSEKRELEDERNKNRERKMKAMGAKQGGSWDEGKDERQAEEERRGGRQGFRGMHGGVRRENGGGAGLAGSRFATSQDTQFFASHGDEQAGGEFRGGRGRGRGRGRGDSARGGRGGRGGFANGTSERVPEKEDFPALPSSSAPKQTQAETEADKSNAGTAPTQTVLDFASLQKETKPLGKWDEEMADLDAEAASASKPHTGGVAQDEKAVAA